MIKIDFLEPWAPVGEYADNLLKELQREVTEHHSMWNRKVRPIGRRTDADDVLFEIEESIPSYAVVHLTWSGGPERNPLWPDTKLFSSLSDWINEGMMTDHQEFIGTGQ